MWKYKSKGNMAGISGNEDISHCYTDFDNQTSIKSYTKTHVNEYTTGTYRLTTNLKVRKGPGTNYKAKSYEQLSTNAKVHATSAGVLKSGTKVDVSEIVRCDSDVWGKILSGYIAIYYKGKSNVTNC